MKSLKSPIIVRIPIIWEGEKMKNCEFITRVWIDTSKIENVGSNNSSWLIEMIKFFTTYTPIISEFIFQNHTRVLSPNTLLKKPKKPRSFQIVYSSKSKRVPILRNVSFLDSTKRRSNKWLWESRRKKEKRKKEKTTEELVTRRENFGGEEREREGGGG